MKLTQMTLTTMLSTLTLQLYAESCPTYTELARNAQLGKLVAGGNEFVPKNEESRRMLTDAVNKGYWGGCAARSAFKKECSQSETTPTMINGECEYGLVLLSRGNSWGTYGDVKFSLGEQGICPLPSELVLAEQGILETRYGTWQSQASLFDEIDKGTYRSSCTVDGLYAQNCSRDQSSPAMLQNTCFYRFILLFGQHTSSWSNITLTKIN